MSTTPHLDELARRYVRAIEKGDLGLSARLQDEIEAEQARIEARLAAPDALAKAAVWYARQGIAVFPCTPRAKTPHGALVPHGLKDATTDAEQVRAWWRACPDANIGAPTGILFDVVDIDGREGVLSVYCKDERGQYRDLPETIGYALTPREAGHHMFIHPTGRSNTTKFLPGVDYRGAGGYVLLAPSVGANGQRYRWTQPLKIGDAGA